jgi:hypothetical protein
MGNSYRRDNAATNGWNSHIPALHTLRAPLPTGFVRRCRARVGVLRLPPARFQWGGRRKAHQQRQWAGRHGRSGFRVRLDTAYDDQCSCAGYPDEPRYAHNRHVRHHSKQSPTDCAVIRCRPLVSLSHRSLSSAGDHNRTATAAGAVPRQPAPAHGSSGCGAKRRPLPCSGVAENSLCRDGSGHRRRP